MDEKAVNGIVETFMVAGIKVRGVKKTETGFKLYIDENSHVELLGNRLNFYVMRRIPCYSVESIVASIKRVKNMKEAAPFSHLNPMFGLYFVEDKCYALVATSVSIGILSELSERLISTYRELVRAISVLFKLTD
ncbi:MAG: hypothetical protein MPF33_08130 [Candidatus Aramenus sp.]|nr:hypothetical protein [Candidatus Aramenus sp.]